MDTLELLFTLVCLAGPVILVLAITFGERHVSERDRRKNLSWLACYTPPGSFPMVFPVATAVESVGRPTVCLRRADSADTMVNLRNRGRSV